MDGRFYLLIIHDCGLSAALPPYWLSTAMDVLRRGSVQLSTGLDKRTTNRLPCRPSSAQPISICFCAGARCQPWPGRLEPKEVLAVSRIFQTLPISLHLLAVINGSHGLEDAPPPSAQNDSDHRRSCRTRRRCHVCIFAARNRSSRAGVHPYRVQLGPDPHPSSQKGTMSYAHLHTCQTLDYLESCSSTSHSRHDSMRAPA